METALEQVPGVVDEAEETRILAKVGRDTSGTPGLLALEALPVAVMWTNSPYRHGNIKVIKSK